MTYSPAVLAAVRQLHDPYQRRPTDGRFARLLTAYREAAGLSQSRLAIEAECDHSYMSRLESGDRLPKREMVLGICDALALGVEERTRLLWAAGLAPDTVDVEDVVALVRGRAV